MRLQSKLALGDCLEVMGEIEDGSVDMVLCDLPYGTTACKWDSVIDPVELWKHYYRVCKANAAMVFTAAQPFTTTLASSNIKDFRYEWIWEKPQGTNPMNAKVMPLKSHENILVFYRKKPTYNPQMTQGTPYGDSPQTLPRLGKCMGLQNQSTGIILRGQGIRKPCLGLLRNAGSSTLPKNRCH